MVTDDQRLVADLHLAMALGWTNLFNAGGSLIGTPPTGGENSRGQAAVPRWTSDWDACGRLMVDLEIEPTFYPENAAAWADGDTDMTALYCDHPSKNQAVMFAIVHAAIEKLLSKLPPSERP